SNSLCKRLAKSDEHQFLNDEEEIGKTEMGLAHRFGRVGCGYHKPLKQKESGVMYLDKHFALRLDNACNRMDLQVHLRRFLNIWTKARATSSACKDALKELGRALDQK